MVQKNLFDDITNYPIESIVTPITIEFVFIIKDDTLSWDGKAYPHVSSGGQFGGSQEFKGDYQIKEIIDNQKLWFEDYGRPIKIKKTVKD